MRRNRTRRSSPPEPFEIICQIGDRLREQYPEVRYSDVVFHNGQQWTRHACWERFEDGEWVEIDDPFFAHTT